MLATFGQQMGILIDLRILFVTTLFSSPYDPLNCSALPSFTRHHLHPLLCSSLIHSPPPPPTALCRLSRRRSLRKRESKAHAAQIEMAMAAEREGDGDEDRDGDGGGRESVAALESMGHGERHILLLISSNIIFPCSSVSHPDPHPHPNVNEDREVVLSRHASIYLCLFSTSHHSLNSPLSWNTCTVP